MPVPGLALLIRIKPLRHDQVQFVLRPRHRHVQKPPLISSSSSILSGGKLKVQGTTTMAGVRENPARLTVVTLAKRFEFVGAQTDGHSQARRKPQQGRVIPSRSAIQPP